MISPSQYSQEMDPQAASTLAQVIPVIALALGLEMRARASRVRGMEVVGYAPQWIGVLAMVTASSLVLFECFALTALFQLNKTQSVGSETILFVGILVVFLLPATDLMSAVFLHPGRRRPHSRWSAILLAVGLMLSSLVLLLLTVLQGESAAPSNPRPPSPSPSSAK